MKQKNLILMVVAVGCGLVAAFLTSQMSAKPKNNETVLVDVLVASKVLEPGTRFTKDSLKDQVKRKKYKPEEVPERAVTDEAFLIDKQLTKTLRADDYVSDSDLGSYRPLEPPPGKDLMTLRSAVDATTPFIKPASKIDIIGTGVTRTQKVVGMLILPDVLVMAVGIETKAPDGATSGNLNIQLTTLAVTSEEALLLRMCETANVRMSFILRSEDAPNRGNSIKDSWTKDSVVKWLQDQQDQGFGGAFGGGNRDSGSSVPQAVDGQRVKLPVPIEDLPAGTEITTELLAQKFKDAEYSPPVPENAARDMRDYVGKYFLEKVFANQFVPRSAIGNKNEPRRSAPSGSDNSPKVAGRGLDDDTESFDRTFTTPTGTKRFRYERKKGGEWKLIGEVKEDGTVVPVQGTAPPGRNPTDPQQTDPQQGGEKPANPKL